MEKSNPYSHRLDQITVLAGNLELRFTHVIDYDTIIRNLLDLEKKIAITSECEINTSFKNMSVAREVLQNCCWILSFATSNWIVFPYYDVYSNGALIKTVILPISEPFEFVKAQYIISNWEKHDSIKDFLETVFDQYIKFKEEFGLNHIIEYYVSAIRNRSLEETFLIIAIAFECLCSYILEFANKKGEDKIANNENEVKNVTFATGFGRITDMDIGPDGNLYVLSSKNGLTVHKIITH